MPTMNDAQRKMHGERLLAGLRQATERKLRKAIARAEKAGDWALLERAHADLRALEALADEIGWHDGSAVNRRTA